MLVNLSLLKVKQDCAIDSHFKPPPKLSYCKTKLLPIFSTNMMYLRYQTLKPLPRKDTILTNCHSLSVEPIPPDLPKGLFTYYVSQNQEFLDPPSVSNSQHLAYPPSPPRQQWSAFGLPPFPPSSAMVSICVNMFIDQRPKSMGQVDKLFWGTEKI